MHLNAPNGTWSAATRSKHRLNRLALHVARSLIYRPLELIGDHQLAIEMLAGPHRLDRVPMRKASAHIPFGITRPAALGSFAAPVSGARIWISPLIFNTRACPAPAAPRRSRHHRPQRRSRCRAACVLKYRDKGSPAGQSAQPDACHPAPPRLPRPPSASLGSRSAEHAESVSKISGIIANLAISLPPNSFSISPCASFTHVGRP